MPCAATCVQLVSSSYQAKSEGARHILHHITYMQNLKCDTNERVYKTKIDSQTWRTDLRLPRGRDAAVGWTGSLGLEDANHYI